jgi:hypothetical protein
LWIFLLVARSAAAASEAANGVFNCVFAMFQRLFYHAQLHQFLCRKRHPRFDFAIQLFFYGQVLRAVQQGAARGNPQIVAQLGGSAVPRCR